MHLPLTSPLQKPKHLTLQTLENRHEPSDVAHFLHAHVDRLDKTVIGDYLGKEKEYQEGFCVKVHSTRRVGNRRAGS